MLLTSDKKGAQEANTSYLEPARGTTGVWTLPWLALMFFCSFIQQQVCLVPETLTRHQAGRMGCKMNKEQFPHELSVMETEMHLFPYLFIDLVIPEINDHSTLVATMCRALGISQLTAL